MKSMHYFRTIRAVPLRLPTQSKFTYRPETCVEIYWTIAEFSRLNVLLNAGGGNILKYPGIKKAIVF